MPLELNGTTGVQGNSGAFVAGTAVASTSGTSIDFTSIPSWVKRVTVMLNGVSTNGTSNLNLQLGIATNTPTTTGYSGYNNRGGGSAPYNFYTANSTSFILITSPGAASNYTGVLTLSLLASNAWVLNGIVTSISGTNELATCAGAVTLSGALSLIRVTANGTDTFDAGSINILYE
jgi:hypothetical protein